MLKENAPLAPLTTLGIGGSARWLIEATTEAEVRDALARAERLGLPALVLGGGSNLVVADGGYPGIVVQVALTGIDSADDDVQRGRMLVTAGAGEDWDAFVRYCAESGWTGIECLAGIPGRVGAAPVQNVGAYGQELADTLAFVRAFDRVEKRVARLTKDECGFGYRRSRFNAGKEAGRYVILSVTLSLSVGGRPTLSYPDLRRAFEGRARPTPLDVYRAVRRIRATKGMVLDARDADSRSAGSFFKNPTLLPEQFKALTEKAGTEMPSFPQPDGRTKVPAAWLIERAGFARGQTLAGRVGLSGKHVLALVNRGGATGADIVAAALLVQTTVKERWGVRIVPEPLFAGFPDDLALPAGAARV